MKPDDYLLTTSSWGTLWWQKENLFQYTHDQILFTLIEIDCSSLRLPYGITIKHIFHLTTQYANMSLSTLQQIHNTPSILTQVVQIRFHPKTTTFCCCSMRSVKLEQEALPACVCITADTQKTQMLSALGFCEVSHNCHSPKDCRQVGHILAICGKAIASIFHW